MRESNLIRTLSLFNLMASPFYHSVFYIRENLNQFCHFVIITWCSRAFGKHSLTEQEGNILL